MTQSKRMSLIETLISVGIGFVVSVTVSIFLYPLFGHSFSLLANMGIIAIFTVISIVRGYLVRRMFVWLHSNFVEQ